MCNENSVIAVTGRTRKKLLTSVNSENSKRKQNKRWGGGTYRGSSAFGKGLSLTLGKGYWSEMITIQFFTKFFVRDLRVSILVNVSDDPRHLVLVKGHAERCRDG